MEKFELTITRQSRVLIAILLFGPSFVGAAYLASMIESTALKVVIPVGGFALVNFCSFYAAYGKLTVIAKDDNLKFIWTKKRFFNFSQIEDIDLKDVKTLILDKDEEDLFDNKLFLRKIITSDRRVSIGTGKYWKKDADNLIWYLKNNTNAKIIDSWDVWREKGIFKIAYGITSLILLAGAVLMVWIISDKGFAKVETRVWCMFVPSYTAMVSYWLVMKRKIKENRW